MSALPKRVLLVEDDDNLVEMAEMAFKGEGIELLVARNGAEGVERASADKPDLILMDVVMPEMNGYEAAKTIRKKSMTKNIPIFFLTAKGLEPDIKEGKETGADLYLVKPFSPFELMDLIRNFFESRA